MSSRDEGTASSAVDTATCVAALVVLLCCWALAIHRSPRVVVPMALLYFLLHVPGGRLQDMPLQTIQTLFGFLITALISALIPALQ